MERGARFGGGVDRAATLLMEEQWLFLLGGRPCASGAPRLVCVQNLWGNHVMGWLRDSQARQVLLSRIPWRLAEEPQAARALLSAVSF